MLRDYIWSLTFVALLLFTYTVIIWQHKSNERQPATTMETTKPPIGQADGSTASSTP